MFDRSRREALLLAGAAGLVVAASPLLAEDKKPVEAKENTDRWRAWAVTEGDKTKLVVEGIYSQGGPGLVVLLSDAVPQGINPKILILDLKTATLPGAWPAILLPVPGWYVKMPYKKDQYTSIHIRYPDGSSVMIGTITDAGKGPM